MGQAQKKHKVEKHKVFDGFFPVTSTNKEGSCDVCDSERLLFTWQYNDEQICIYCIISSLQETIRDAKIQDWEFYEHQSS
jgi:hypothetical protein